MPTLHELQCRFRDALLENDPKCIESQIRFDDIPAQTRLGVYRNNVFTNLREALRTLFPVINKLVGEAFFSYAADDFIRRYPSPAGDLNQFGEQFAEFWSAFAPAAELVYLPDTARLEWLAHQAYHAANAPPFERQRLVSIPPEAYGELQFVFNPACALLESKYPVHRIWQVNQAGYPGEETVDLSSGGTRLLIQRCHGLIELQPLEMAEWVLLSALAGGEDFATACSKTLQADPKFELSHALGNLIMQDTLVDFRQSEPSEFIS